MGMHIDMLTQGHVYRQYRNFIYGHRYAQTHNHPDSHMANRSNLMYNTGMHIDISLHMDMHSPHMDNTQDLPHEQVCILVIGN